MKHPLLAPILAIGVIAAPLNAQETDEAQPQDPEKHEGENKKKPFSFDFSNVDFSDYTVFDDTWVTLGVGVGIGTSYDGSDNYRVIPAPIVQGEVAGIGISPRAAGLALDFLPDREKGLDISVGPTVRFRSDRADLDSIDDPVVELAGELDSAFEVGASVGLTKHNVFKQLDAIGFTVDARWDVAGAHDGMVVEPSVSYRRTFGAGTIVIASLSAEFVDDDYAEYYYSVSPAQSAASGLAQFDAEGGLNSVGLNLFSAFDLDGNALNGGLSIVVIGGYSRLFGDAADTPYTAERGSANQMFGALGLGYTF